jgi:hypothetical protein
VRAGRRARLGAPHRGGERGKGGDRKLTTDSMDGRERAGERWKRERELTLCWKESGGGGVHGGVQGRLGHMPRARLGHARLQG